MDAEYYEREVVEAQHAHGTKRSAHEANLSDAVRPHPQPQQEQDDDDEDEVEEAAPSGMFDFDDFECW